MERRQAYPILMLGPLILLRRVPMILILENVSCRLFTISEPKKSSNSFMNELNLYLRRCSKAICHFATLAMQASRAL
jgi:hypothetical protein